MLILGDRLRAKGREPGRLDSEFPRTHQDPSRYGRCGRVFLLGGSASAGGAQTPGRDAGVHAAYRAPGGKRRPRTDLQTTCGRRELRPCVLNPMGLQDGERQHWARVPTTRAAPGLHPATPCLSPILPVLTCPQPLRRLHTLLPGHPENPCLGTRTPTLPSRPAVPFHLFPWRLCLTPPS